MSDHQFESYDANPDICRHCGAVRPMPCYSKVWPDLREPDTEPTPDFEAIDAWAAEFVAGLDPDQGVALLRAIRAKAETDNTRVTYMDLDEFHQTGYLHEVNRQVLHPAGLAIEIIRSSDGKAAGFGGVWDYRSDPEGMCMAGSMLSAEKIAAVAAEVDRHRDARIALFGTVIQEPKP